MEQSEIPAKSTLIISIIFGGLAIIFIIFSLFFLQFVSKSKPLETEQAKVEITPSR